MTLRKRILARLAGLETNPRPADVKKLKGRDAWRIGVIAEDNSDIAVVKELIRKLKPPSSFCVRHFVGNGCGKLRHKGRAWANQLRLNGCSALLSIHDLDRHKLAKLRADLTTALAPGPVEKYVIVIPIEEIEAWLMCDASALKKVFGLKKLPNLPNNPESVASPKQQLESLVWRHSGKTRRYINTVHNPVIAKHSNIATLRKCAAFHVFENFVRVEVK